MSFSEIATQIVKSSIRTAICIDDEFAEPYEKPTEDFSDDLPKRMYESFRDTGNCSLNFYRYRSQEHWESNSNFVLSNKDLIVLDWELDKVEPKYKSTLPILENIIENGTNQFVIVYTHLEALDSIVRNIKAFYSPINIKTQKAISQDIIDSFESSGAEFNDLTKTIEAKISIGNIFNHDFKLSNILMEAGLDGADVGKFIKDCRDILPLSTNEEILAFLLLDIYKLREYCSLNVREVVIVESERIILNIDNTIVLISNKSFDGEEGDKILPEQLFNAFTEAIISKPNNAMALMACNLKDIFRINVTHIGKNIPEINEEAFYHHWRNIRKEENLTEKEADEQFKDFLFQTWLNELSQFTIKKSSDNEFFEALLQYGKENGLLGNTRSEAPIDDLIKLGAHYSTVKFDVLKRSDKKIQFGDIFWKQDTSITMNEVLLSITPHCDSIRPEKIGNMLHFVKGTVIKNDEEKIEALQKSETEHYSFLEIDREPICIKWVTKPFSIFVKRENNDVSKLIEIELKEVAFKLKHITILKENYTQRIANQSFSYAMRIGITLPSLKN